MIARDSTAWTGSAFDWLNGKESTELVHDLRRHVSLVREVIQVTDHLTETCESDHYDELLEGLNVRADLVNRLDQSGKSLGDAIHRSPRRPEIERALKPFLLEMVHVDRQLVAMAQKKKQDTVVHLTKIQQQKKLMSYLREGFVQGIGTIV